MNIPNNLCHFFLFLQHINNVFSRLSVLSVLFLIFSSVFCSFSVFFAFGCLWEIYFCHLLTVTRPRSAFPAIIWLLFFIEADIRN